MSHSSGYVLFKDNLKLFYEYNGTVDIVLPKLWNTMKEVDIHWREYDPFDRKCICGKEPEPVQIYTSYGGGYYFEGTACRTCMLIIDNEEIYFSVDGEPELNEK